MPTISTDLFDAWMADHVARWVPQVLLLCVPVLLAWFPGFNARQRGHDHAQGINATSWLLAVSVAWFFVTSDSDVLPLLFPFLTLWTAAAAWSYGKHDRMPAAVPARGFEIAMLRPLGITFDLAISK
jgi:Trk-type K+ transport system membrane component